ncbi:MAG: tryptophan--tRNA ligase [Candidatus Magasanikbacteria bacterium]|nr:tryptophan--tRNA ligase [Candidatus Magasanikbacteria bacterium]
MKPVIVSGIQPTGNLHIGNYLGAVKNWVDLQNSGKYQCYFFIADYHSFTGEMSGAERQEKILNIAAELLAAGIDPKKSTLFVQSQVPGHTELAWIFNTVTPIAELYRMTQFKDKSERQDKNINTGLLTYPVLQAADIVLYRGTAVPVGQDQVQHVELTRDIARWFNNRYGNYFVEPKALLTEIPKVMSLLEPTKKMSKSHGLNSVIELADEPEVIANKLKKAVTATEGGEAPGVQNLLVLLKHFGTQEDLQAFTKAAKDGTIRYGDLKTAVGMALAARFAEFRTKRADYLKHPAKVKKILAEGAERADKVAAKTMKEVREMVGLG